VKKVSCIADRSRGNCWRLRWSQNRKRFTVTWTGDGDAAQMARGHVEHLLETGLAKLPHASTRLWIE
jgi:hypothetical protein